MTALALVPEPDAPDTLDAFAVWMRSWSASERTIEERIIHMRAMLRSVGEPETVRTDDLVQWMANPSFSANTRVTYYYNLRSFFGWLHESGRIPTNPTVALRSPRTPRDLPRPLTDAEAQQLLEAARPKVRAWLLLAFQAGLRAHEIAKIRGEDVTVELLYVFGKGRKAAEIPTHPELWELAQHYPAKGYWFPGNSGAAHVQAKSVSAITSRLFDGLRIEGSIHRCRHTYATQLLRRGANIRVVQTLMRHDTLATTARYCAVSDHELAEAILLLGVVSGRVDCEGA